VLLSFFGEKRMKYHIDDIEECVNKLDTIIKTILAGAGLSLFIEVTQLFCLGRHTDVDDLILNTFGTVIGTWIVFTIRGWRKKHLNIKCRI